MSTEVEVRETSTELSVDEIKGQVNLIQRVMAEVMTDGQHYGVIPGTNKPTLLKAGAEKLGITFRLAPEFDIDTVDLGNGHRDVRVLCRLRHIVTDSLVGSGVGSCSTMESKYRWRAAGRVCPSCGEAAIIRGKEEYGGGWLCFKKKDGCGAKFKIDDTTITSQDSGRVENEDIADVYNTVLKMSKKRAHIDAMLTATAASDIFTQDLDETTPRPETTNNDGAAMLAKLFTVITEALRSKELTPKQAADTALGLDTFLEAHPDNNVSDYTKGVESKLKKKREPTQPLGTPVTINGKPDPTKSQTGSPKSGSGTTTEAATSDDPVIADAKSKVEMLDGINRTAEKADEPPDGELDIF